MLLIQQVLRQITEIEDNISRLQKAIADKDAPIKLSETRLENRTGRPNVELCRDQVSKVSAWKNIHRGLIS